MTLLRLIIRSISFLLIIICGSLLTLLFQRGTMPTTGLASTITRFFHRSLTTALGVRIKINGNPNKTATLFISNHVSWLDILIIGQIVPTHFLSMIEVKSWPVAGWLATRAGTIYISRGGKIAATSAVEDISHVLDQQHNMVIFAEGKVTDGHIKKFHSRLLQSAIESQSQIQAITLRYPDKHDGVLNPTVLFTGKITPLQSFFRVMAAKHVEAEITFLEPVSSAQRNRSELAAIAEKQIRAQLGQTIDS